MRIAKKLTALVLVIAMLMTASVTSFALSFSDVTDRTRYNKAITTMVSLGLLKGYEDGTFKPENTITRAEFAAVMTRAIGMEGMVGSASATSIFTDMKVNDQDHWANGYVRIAYDKGIILGMGDGTFAPDSPVTYEQAVKMIVCALGREIAANDAGGWPNGYLTVAKNIGLTDGALQSPTNGPAPRGIVAQLVFNSLEIKLMEKTLSGNITLTDKTLLKDMLKISSFYNMMVTEVDGVLSVNAGASKANVGEFVLESGINKDLYNYENVLTADKARELLGHYVSGYYKYDENIDRRIIVSLDTSEKNTEITIKSTNIDSFAARKLDYWKNIETDSRTQEAIISADAKLIYNGVAYDYLNSNVAAERNLTYWLSPSGAGFINGEVRLLDSGSDGEFEAIFIEDYQTFVVKSAVKTNDANYMNNYLVYDYYTTGKSIQIDPYARNNTVSIYNAKTGAEMQIEKVKAMNILSVAASYDKRSFKCYVSTDTLSGTITSTTSSTPKKYNINNNAYELTKEFEAVVAAGKVEMSPGSAGKFYLDKDGKIAAATITEVKTGNYTYITAAGKYDMSGENAAIEIISVNGNPATPTKYKVAGKVRINNKTLTDTTSILDELENSAKLLDSNTGAANAKYSQLAKVVIDSNNEVTSIITAATMLDGSGATVLDVGSNTNAATLKIGQESKEYLYSTNSGFESQVFVDSSTLVLVVPTDRRDATKYKRNKAKSYFSTGKKYTIEAYDMNASATAKVVVLYGDEADVAINRNTPTVLVANRTEIMSAINGDRVYNIDVYENGVLKSYETESATPTYELNVGDVVRLGYNSNGQINSVEKQFEIANPVPAKKTAGSLYLGDYEIKSIFGTVASMTPERLIIAPALVDKTVNPPTLDQSQKEGYALNTAVKVYRVTKTGGTPTIEANVDINSIIEFGDIALDPNATTVYAYALMGTLKIVVIYQ